MAVAETLYRRPPTPVSEPLPDAVSLDDLPPLAAPLLAWFRAGHRPMPWRETKDPYAVWISEAMLQQTRVEQAEPYFRRFVDAFPTAAALADAPLDDVLKRWEGLGYYARARNLHRAAQQVRDVHGGAVPSDYDAFRALPGVGPYTAAAVLSIAHDAPHAVLDGNVVRVLTRLFAVADDAKRPATLRHLQRLADALLPPEASGDYNQAVMELGATVCTPRAPRCAACPVATFCRALAEGQPTAYPVAAKKAPVPHADVAVALLYDADGRMLVQQRPADKMLGGLWELPGGKVEPGERPEAAVVREVAEELGVVAEAEALVARVGHAYSHLRVTLHAYRCRLVSGVPTSDVPLRWTTAADRAALAFPRATHKVFDALDAAEAAPSLFG